MELKAQTLEELLKKAKKVEIKDETASTNSGSQLKGNPLEKTILSNTRTNVFYYNPLTNKLKYPKTSTDLSKDYKSGAAINYVPASQLPDGVLGMYNPASHSITLSSNLSSYAERFVMAHESAHAQGCYDEALTDARASSSIGYGLRRFGQESSFIN